MKKKGAALVSIIISYFNDGNYIEEAIKSCQKQTYREIEIIIIDDGTFESSSIQQLERMKIKYPQITYIRTSNRGISAARNAGVKRSKGIYICCLDSDDFILPEYINESVKILNKDQRVAFAATWIKLCGKKHETLKPEENNIAKLLSSNLISSGSVYRKSVWEEVGGYSTSMESYEDWDFWIRIVAAGRQWKVIKKPLYMYRIHNDSRSYRMKNNRYKYLRTLIKRNKNIFQDNMIDLIVHLHRYNDRLLNTKAWRFFDKLRLLRNWFTRK